MWPPGFTRCLPEASARYARCGRVHACPDRDCLLPRSRVLNILAAVAVAFLLCDPGQLFEASFQLSFAAVAAIGALAAPIVEGTAAILQAACRKFDRMRPSPSEDRRVSSLRIELRLVAHTLHALLGVRQAIANMVVVSSGRMLASIFEMVILSATVQFALTVPAVLYSTGFR